MNFAIGDQRTVNSKVAEIFEKLTKMGLDKQKIMDYYEHKSLADFTVDDCRSLIGIGTAIKEGHIKIDDVFNYVDESEEKLSAAEKVNNLIMDKAKKTGEANASKDNE